MASWKIYIILRVSAFKPFYKWKENILSIYSYCLHLFHHWGKTGYACIEQWADECSATANDDVILVHISNVQTNTGEKLIIRRNWMLYIC